MLGDWDRPERRPAAVRRLRHARDLVGFDSILKPPDILLAEVIRAYAEGLPAPSPFLLPGDEQRGRIIDMLTSVADGKDEYTGAGDRRGRPREEGRIAGVDGGRYPAGARGHRHASAR